MRRALPLMLALLAACTTGERPSLVAGDAPTTTSASRAPAPTTTAAPASPGGPVTFAFGGDVHFEGELRQKLDADAAGMLAPIAGVLSGADLAVVNLETAITERGTPADKEFTFRAPPSAFAALRGAGIDVATMANNHGLDYGLEGLADTLAGASAAGFPVIGIGVDEAAAYAPYIAAIKGQRIAVIAATNVLDDELVTAWTATTTHGGLASAKRIDRLIRAVSEARAAADTVVVYVHWGIETQTCPEPRQPALAAKLVDAGADIVVGSHTHRLQGAGRKGSALVAYGLGNFVFYAKPGPAADSGVLLVTATGRTVDSYSWVPARINGGVPRPLAGPEKEAAVTTWSGLRSCTALTP